MDSIPAATEARLLDLHERHPDALVLGVEPSGASVVPVPADLLALFGEELDVVNGGILDQLGSTSQGQAVVLFEAARRNGWASGLVPFGDETIKIELFDLSESRGLLLAVIVYASEPATAAELAPRPVPRRMVMELTATAQILAIDPATTAALGWSEADLVGHSTTELVHPDDLERGVRAWGDLLSEPGGQRRVRQRVRHADGSWVWMELTHHNLLHDPAYGHVSRELVDVSEEMAAQEALRDREELLGRLAEALPTGVMQLDLDERPVFANGRWFDITGIERVEDQRTFLPALETSAELEVKQAIAAVRAGAAERDVELTLIGDDQGSRHALLRLRPLKNQEGNVSGIVLCLEDTTDNRRLQDELSHLATRDPLTGLLNRAGILDRIESVISRSGQTGRITAAMFIDLDGFKVLNDTRSHAFGDEVLCAVAETIDASTRDQDMTGRFGGDEFLVLIDDVTSPDNAYALAARVEREIEELAGRWSLPVTLSASAGIAFAQPGDTALELVARADVQMYERKNRKRAAAPTR